MVRIIPCPKKTSKFLYPRLHNPFPYACLEEHKITSLYDHNWSKQNRVGSVSGIYEASSYQ